MLFLKMAPTKLMLFCMFIMWAAFLRVKAASLNMDKATSLQRVNCPKSSVHVLLPHPTDCRQFFTCDYGVAHLTACQKGLHFNGKLQACDYPENAGCQADVAEVPRGKEGKGISNALCPSEKTRHLVYRPHPTDCGKFYVCDGGTPHLKVCQQGLHFNPKTQTCDYPRNVGCDSSVVTDKPHEKTGGCPAVNNGNPVLLPHKTDCGKFYICDSGVPLLKICQAGLHFNPKVQACDYPAKAGCRPVGRLLSVGVSTPLCPTIEGKSPVFYSHPSNCSAYFMCSNGYAYKFECPARLHFNLEQKICDYETVANCTTGKSSAYEDTWMKEIS